MIVLPADGSASQPFQNNISNFPQNRHNTAPAWTQQSGPFQARRPCLCCDVGHDPVCDGFHHLLRPRVVQIAQAGHGGAPRGQLSYQGQLAWGCVPLAPADPGVVAGEGLEVAQEKGRNVGEAVRQLSVIYYLLRGGKQKAFTLAVCCCIYYHIQ